MTSRQALERGGTMDDHILLVGENSALLATRAMLLSDWNTVSASPSEALSLLQADSFDGIVLCHSVRTDEANALIVLANKSLPQPAILSIRVPGDPELAGAVHHL